MTKRRSVTMQLTGEPTHDVRTVPMPKTLSVVPHALSFIKPRVLVAEGDTVKIGTPLFIDKRDDRLVFNSPASGKVASITFGERRCIEEIRISADKAPKYLDFDTVSDEQLPHLSRRDVVSKLLVGGVWPLLRSFPFRDIADPDVTPPSIIVSVTNNEPFRPSASVYLDGQLSAFSHGLSILKRLSPAVHVTCSLEDRLLLDPLSDLSVFTIDGIYPAHDPGVFLYDNKQSADENSAWYISGQDVILLGQLFQTGRFPHKRIMCVGGSKAKHPSHYDVPMGISITDLLQDELPKKGVRYVAGGHFVGRQVQADNCVSFYEDAVQLIAADDPQGFMEFLDVGGSKQTISRAYLSSFLPQKESHQSAGLKGSERDCISCGICPEVCPVDILPQVLLKQLKVDDVEEGMRLGLLDCTSCGLCTYVCPSKIDLNTIFDTAKASLAKEISS